MSPTIILIRHAQAEHNVTKNYEIPDPPLTQLGLDQCRDLRNFLASHPLYSKIDLIVISPMNRTLETATHSLEPLIKAGVPVTLSALFQENSAKPCDTGTPITSCEERWPQYDWSQVDPVYPSKEGIYEYSKKGLTERGIAARKWLRERPEKVIAVVSHSGFLRVGLSYRHYDNADFRIFDFGEGKDEVGGELIEWKETEGKEGASGGMGKSLFGVAGWETQDTFEKVDGEAVKEEPEPLN